MLVLFKIIYTIKHDNDLQYSVTDGSVCACDATEENFTLLEVVTSSDSTSIVFSNLTDSDSNIIDKSKNTNNSGTKTERWSKDATLFLIDQWQKNSSKFASSTIRNEEVWKNIVKEIENAGFPKYTWKQAEDKWKNIRKGYMKAKDNRGDKSSGAPRVTCKFYDELDEIFSKSPSVEPISIASSRNNKSFASDIDSDGDENFKHQPIKKKKTKVEKDVLSLLSTFKEDSSAREVAREKRHQEMLNVLSKAIDSYEVQMEKLIDKL